MIYSQEEIDQIIAECKYELNEKDKEMENLNSIISDYVNIVLHDRKEIDRLNGIIKELEKDLDLELTKLRHSDEYNKGLFNAFKYTKDKLQELKGDDK